MQSVSGSVNGPAVVGVNLIDFFDVVPASLWLGGYSDLRRLFAEWRVVGVTDLRHFLGEDVPRVAAYSACIKILRVSRRTLSVHTAPSTEALTTRLADVLRDNMLKVHVGELIQLWSGEPSFESRSVNYTLDGRRPDILLKDIVLSDHAQPWGHVAVTVDDITELEGAHCCAAASQLYARGVFEYTPVSLQVENFSTIKILLDEVRMQGIIDFRTFTDVHPGFVKRCMQGAQVLDVNGFTLEMFKTCNCNNLLDRLPGTFHDDVHPHFREQLIDSWGGELFQQCEVVNYGLDDNPLNIHLQFSVFPGREKDWDVVLLALTDITARKRAESYLEYLGKHNALTKLKSRSFYVDETNRLGHKGPFPVTVIMIDLNDLKHVSDQLGYAAGNVLLRHVGEVPGKAVDKPAHAAHTGDDKFAMLLPGADAQAGAVLVESLRKLVELNNQFHLSAGFGFSMGCVTRHESGRLEETLREADVAMYEGKRVQHEGKRTI